VVDRYLWLQLIGLAPLYSPSAMVLEVCGLSWLVDSLFAEQVGVDEENNQ
jgi:hypothetical protein